MPFQRFTAGLTGALILPVLLCGAALACENQADPAQANSLKLTHLGDAFPDFNITDYSEFFPGPLGTGTRLSGNNSYIGFPKWSSSSNVRVQVWFGDLDKREDQRFPWTHIVGSSEGDQTIRVDRNSVQVQFGSQFPGIYDAFDFEETRFMYMEICRGQLSITDGIRLGVLTHTAISPERLSYDRAYTRENNFYKGVVQAFALQDIGNEANSVHYRAIGYEKLLPDTKTQFELVNVKHVLKATPINPPTNPGQPPDPGTPITPPNPGGPGVPPNPGEPDKPITPPTVPIDPPNQDKLDLSSSAIKTQADWDAAFLALYKDRRPVMNITVGDDTGRFAWEAPVWIKAYITMAEAFGDGKYIEWAVELVDHLFNYTDEKRVERGEIKLDPDGYWQAPKFYMNNYGTPVPGWRHYNPKNGKKWRVQALQDGRILSGVMALVNFIKRHQIQELMPKADEYLAKAQRIVDSHDTSYSQTKQADVVGSYYYPNTNDQIGDNGLFSRPIPFNHNLSQAFVQMYIEKWTNGASGYQTRVNQLTTFFTDKLEDQNDGTCIWRYQHHSQNPNTKFEDLNHGDIDIEFINAADREGYFNNEAVMNCLTKNFSERMKKSADQYANLVDGSGIASGAHQINTGWHWVGLTKYDPQVKRDVLATINRHSPTPTWYGTYLAWANMLKLAQ
ncbi:hypothetical protein [Paraferrimonas sedimenticola]|uniref:Uncharacterized protein n=1 Tax=Paraferrimonas sedimenticola TaxID=375674 RepID=A0AA37RVF3_9GAMM|nr:hypothetical protein [Paraferrimonas sedimenticola]GLP95971.1 hypothetical protein GCM10007895_12770 [Paraferrimonas sedimenticola]